MVLKLPVLELCNHQCPKNPQNLPLEVLSITPRSLAPRINTRSPLPPWETQGETHISLLESMAPDPLQEVAECPDVGVLLH